MTPHPQAPALHEAVAAAVARRGALLEQLAAEDTDCVRLFHGIAEGRPGVAIDRYGPVVLGQCWRQPPTSAEQDAVSEVLDAPVVWHVRGDKSAPRTPRTTCRERGLTFSIQAVHGGLDPWLFLDFRSGRRTLARLVEDRQDAHVLNTFAYTATAGVVAAAAGAARVQNVDHARRWTSIGRDNAAENNVEMGFITADYFAAVRQMAGLKVGRRGRKLPRVQRATFDVVVLDPPTRTKGPFGAVDIEGDYPSLFKPAWLVVRPGGALLATNHSPKVALDDWLDLCRRCASKAGTPVAQVDVVPVDSDFPSFDGAPPLKMAVFHKA